MWRRLLTNGQLETAYEQSACGRFGRRGTGAEKKRTGGRLKAVSLIGITATLVVPRQIEFNLKAPLGELESIRLPARCPGVA